MSDAFQAEYDARVTPRFGKYFELPDGAARLVAQLREQITADQAALSGDEQRTWELCGLYYINRRRFHEGLAVFHAFYDHLLSYQQQSNSRVHKGMPLCWLSDCYAAVGCPILARRYLMLTTCEDSIRDEGHIDAGTSGVYFRWIMQYGLSHDELNRYDSAIWEIYQQNRQDAAFPEWIVQELDHQWMAGYPSPVETGLYIITAAYAHHLLNSLGAGDGKSLERLAHYLLGSIPGCRAYKRQRSHSTDYDVVCAFEGADLDFRSDLGRYFICECKDWRRRASFTAFAKFCRVLDAAKCRFGILFSKHDISGKGSTTNAEREQLKVFHDRGLVVVVIAEPDLRRIASGANFVTILRERYEKVRLDLKKRT